MRSGEVSVYGTHFYSEYLTVAANNDNSVNTNVKIINVKSTMSLFVIYIKQINMIEITGKVQRVHCKKQHSQCLKQPATIADSSKELSQSTQVWYHQSFFETDNIYTTYLNEA
jgi:hypothetical protein